ncbi:MAG: glycoside hydrolase family 28 protein [Opitutaceae bacterium]
MPQKLALSAILLAVTPFISAAAPSSFNVLDYGAVADGKTLTTAAIASAVTACAAAHGGTVVFPAGRYLTGSIELQSNMTLQLEPGSELLYSGNPADSPLVPSRWESTNAYTHGPLIYANGRENVAVTGRGTINGQGVNWWWRNGTYAPERAAEARPYMEAWLKLYERIEAGEKPGPAEFSVAAAYLRPSLVQFYGCRNVLVEGVTLTESPMWLLHPVYSENVSIRGVTFASTGPNGDGIDVDSCRNVRISDCFFSTGDDCIVIKSGRDADGRRTARPTEHVAITNCVMYKGHGAVVIGSETSGGIRDVIASNIVSHGTQRGIRIKSMRGRGNTVENLRFDNFVIDDATEEAIEITTLYRDQPAEPLSYRTPVFKNFAFSNMTIVRAAQVASIHGLPEKAVEQLRFSDITATGTTGFICDQSADVELHDVRVDTVSGNAFVFDKVLGLELHGVTSMSPHTDQPVLDLTDCSRVSVSSSWAAAGTNVFLEHHGDAAGGLRLINNDFSGAKVGVYPAIPQSN